VAIDGQDVRQFDPPSVREQIAAVLQEPMLFNTSVRDNLRYARLDATDAEIEMAARAAEAHAFICELPDGYDTLVGPRGARLSGGQRQRLAIARALVKAAPIVLLDEATSALDPVTEAAVLDALRTRLAGSSVLLVAHRLSTIRQADRIVVLERGRVVEQGTHDQLVGQPGAYRRLYEAQASPRAAA
jgi:ABC-type multidrug transport system fused ATPase/permease subunit